MKHGWTPASLARAYGMSEATLNRLQDGAKPTDGSETADPRPAMLDARACIQTLSGLLISLCRAGEHEGASRERLESASGLSHMTLHRRLARPAEGAGDPDDAWRVWMPEDQGVEGLAPHAAALAASAMAVGGANEQRLQRLLRTWERQPRILRDSVSGLRILPQTARARPPSTSSPSGTTCQPAPSTTASNELEKVVNHEPQKKRPEAHSYLAALHQG